LISSWGIAGEKRYRIEILVLTHLQHESIPSEAGSLRDFSKSLDFLNPEKEGEEEGDVTREENTGAEIFAVTDPVIGQTGIDESGEAEPAAGQEMNGEMLPNEDLPEDPWADVIAVKEMSDVMREAWRRLRLGAPFRPEQYLAWEQSADEPFPSLRIHDPEVILINDPYAEVDKPVVFTDQGGELPGDPIEIDTDTSAEDSEPPDPIHFYRIDGTVVLRRSRFLHLDLDVELRQPVFDQLPLTAAPVLGGEDISGEPEPPVPTSFLIHELKQSRQVKSQRMEYFDSPVLGVLAWITAFETGDEGEEEVASLPN